MSPREDDLRLPLWAGPLAGESAKLDVDPVDAFPGAAVVAVCDEDSADVVRVPPYGRAPHTLALPRVAKLGGRLRHWVDVLELSLAAKESARVRLGLVDGKNDIRGKVDIHPTATVIGSILEDGVRLEQHASVIDSYVGTGALVADHSVIHSCVVGERCRTLVDTSLRRCVAMEDSTLSNLGMSDVILGKHVFLTMSVATFGPDPGSDVVVDGIDTHRAVLGGAVGSRCVLGSRALWRAGVALPPGILVVARPGEAVAKLDDAGLARAASMRGDRTKNA
jgi:carbonic anhydrase/acetyltransferase-like protein (isoleucine patch superfamily)